MSDDAFPTRDLAANRSGRLSAEQRAALGRMARTSSRSGLQAGLAIAAFGALLVYGAVSGRIANGRIGALFGGALAIVIGLALALARGNSRTASAGARAAGGDDRVERVTGDLRKVRDDPGAADALLGVTNRYRHDDDSHLFLTIGDRRFAVTRAQFDAAPEGSSVAGYVLPGTDHLVNLERLGPSSTEQAGRAGAEALGIVLPRDPGAPDTTAAPVDAPLDGEDLRLALIGTWVNSGVHLQIDLRADGSAGTGHARRSGRPEVDSWAVIGPDRILFGNDEVSVHLDGATLLFAGPDGAGIRLERG